jgi:UDP-glucose 4-epimerase
MSSVLVTGGAGFIGSHVVDILIHHGYAVTVVDDLSSGKQENIHPAACFHHLDIRSSGLRDIFTANSFDWVFHFAGQIDVRKSIDDPLFDSQVNISGLLNLMEACRRYPVKGIVFASSGGTVYGRPEKLPVNETTAKRPISPYGLSKLCSEQYLYYYQQVHHLPYIALRYGNVYGPRQDKNGEAGVIAIFAGKMLAGEDAVIYGDGQQERDFVFVEDVAEANLCALQKMDSLSSGSIDDRAFNIAAGTGTSINALFKQMKAMSGYSRNVQYAPAKIGEEQRIVLDIRKAATGLGWRPAVSLSLGLQKTLDYWRKAIT